MVALTQEKREELVRQLTDAIEDLSVLEGDTDAIWLVEVYEIALASLTVEPIAYTSERALSDVYCGDTSMMGGGYDIGNIPLFISPPVTEIKLPDKIGNHKANQSDEYYEGFQSGWNECLEETKSLNGLED